MDPDRIVDRLERANLELLTGRKEVVRDRGRLRQCVEGRTIMVTGAAGSVGSEISRHVAGLGARRLVLFDQSESGLFGIETEIRRSSPFVATLAVLGDVRDPRSVEDAVARYSIDSIYHAAAYKHLPMMERHVVEAVRNNVLGTWNVVRSAMRHRVDRLILVSSDKAVNPTSVMGATKRLAESIVLAAGAGGRGFASVRCGNVIGSVGSVVPVFAGQIAFGGPVTLTDRRARRYFMSPREAVEVLIEVSGVGREGRVFVPDMGAAVGIRDIADRMIRLAGFVPERDVAIRITGLRPGEKVEEELTAASEQTQRSALAGSWVAGSAGIGIDPMQEVVAEFSSLIDRRDPCGIIQQLMRAVPEYSPQHRAGPLAARPADAVARRGA